MKMRYQLTITSEQVEDIARVISIVEGAADSFVAPVAMIAEQIFTFDPEEDGNESLLHCDHDSR